MEADAALAELRALADPARAAKMAACHKTTRETLGVANPDIDALARRWRTQAGDAAARAALADGLWRSGVFEARIAAAKLLTQARITGDEAVWRVIVGWVPDFDGRAIADHACMAGQRRLSADPARLDEVEAWAAGQSLWTRRAALVIALPWAKGRHPSDADRARRERILGWAAAMAPDRRWFIHKAIGWWLRTLAPHDPARVRAFLAEHGDVLRPVALREATRRLPV